MTTKTTAIKIKKTKKPTATTLNLVAVVADQSGSMNNVRVAAGDMIRGVFAGYHNPPKGQETRVSYYTFSTAVVPEFKDYTTGTEVVPDYRIIGSTNLHDAIGIAVTDLKNHPRANEKNTAFTLIIITDGEHNHPGTWSQRSIQTLIRDTQATSKWTYVVHCPPNKKYIVVNELGVPEGNVREWERTDEGTQEVAQQTNSGTTSYYKSRAEGQSATSAFFQPDLSRVTPRDVKIKLTDVSTHFKLFDMAQEGRIDEFVVKKTHKPYVFGQAYYQLMKDETVQKNKDIVLMEINGGAVWGGPATRTIIGLPKDQDAQVKPGNHAGFNIFIQSRSSNRKLPRGTKLLIDVTRTKGEKPTWEDLSKA